MGRNREKKEKSAPPVKTVALSAGMVDWQRTRLFRAAHASDAVHLAAAAAAAAAGRMEERGGRLCHVAR